MRNPKSLVVALIVTVGLFCLSPFFAGVGAVLFVLVVVEGRQDAKRRMHEEYTVARMSAHVESVLAEAETAKTEALRLAEAAREAREAAIRQLEEFAARELSRVEPSPQELFDQYQEFRIETDAKILACEVEEFLRES